MPIWITQEAADLGAPVMRRDEKRNAPREQRLVWATPMEVVYEMATS